jgi:Domain of unknown function (DUF1905)
MAKTGSDLERRGPFVTTLLKYPGKGGWTFAIIPRRFAPPVTRPWGRTPVLATVGGLSWHTSIWRDAKNDRALLPVPRRLRGAIGSGERVTMEFTFQKDTD